MITFYAMEKEKALRAIHAKWQRLSTSERQTEAQLLKFSLDMAKDPDYWFNCKGDRYQDIMGYMEAHTVGLKRLGP